MKIAIIYFSGTGNTKRVAEVYKKYFEVEENEVDLIDISTKKELVGNYDLYILGSPTYSKVAISKLTEFFAKNIDNEKNKGKEVMTFVTHSWSEVFGHITLQKYVEKLGYKVVAANTFLMPNAFYMMNKEKNTKGEIESLHKNVVVKVEQIIEGYSNGQINIEEKNNVKRKASEILYKGLNKTWIPTFAAKNLKVDDDKCTRCTACVKQCPSNNISLETGRITFSDKCLACAKCLNICPKNAFMAKGKTFEQYNIRGKIILGQFN